MNLREQRVLTGLSVGVFCAGMWLSTGEARETTGVDPRAIESPFRLELSRYESTGGSGQEELAADQFMILQRVVSALIEDSEDIGQSVVEMVDREFWNLL